MSWERQAARECEVSSESKAIGQSSHCTSHLPLISMEHNRASENYLQYLLECPNLVKTTAIRNATAILEARVRVQSLRPSIATFALYRFEALSLSSLPNSCSTFRACPLQNPGLSPCRQHWALTTEMIFQMV